MTICLGVLAGDGLIIAADTEETDGFLKTNQQKISVSVNIHLIASVNAKKHTKGKVGVPPVATCAIAGAGNAGYLDSITPLLAKDFGDGKKSVEASQGDAGKTVRTFFREHVIPFAAYPLLERPDFAMLIGTTQTGGPNILLASEKTVLRQCAPYAAVGVGATFAMLLLKRLWPQAWVDKKSATLIVAYIMFLVKESVENCGKFTDIVVLHDGTRHYLPWQVGRELETMFLRYWRLEADAMLSLFGMSPRHQQQSVRHVTDIFKAFREEIEKLAKNIVLEDHVTR
jgi:hypothetical protein